jgi:hypothetical protein
LLRKQTWFKDEITFLGPGQATAFGISLLENEENAEAYSCGTYSEVTKILVRVVSNSTFHKIAAAIAA